MLCVLAGIPNAFVNKVEATLRKRLTGCVPLSAPATPAGGGWLSLSLGDAKALSERLVNHLAHNDKALSGGCCVIAFASLGGNVDDFIRYLEPTFIAETIWLPVPLTTIGKPGEIAANRMANEVVDKASSLMAAVREVQSELSNRLTRTPLHLPMRNFTSEIFVDTIVSLARSLSQTKSHSCSIKAACEKIETAHPFRSQGNRRSFSDNDHKRFLMPGRELHGLAHRGLPHNAMCVLSSRLRFGGALPDGFHFDCVRNENDCLEGALPNCHDAAENMKGKPHVNIGPNDGLR